MKEGRRMSGRGERKVFKLLFGPPNPGERVFYVTGLQEGRMGGGRKRS